MECMLGNILTLCNYMYIAIICIVKYNYCLPCTHEYAVFPYKLRYMYMVFYCTHRPILVLGQSCLIEPLINAIQ